MRFFRSSGALNAGNRGAGDGCWRRSGCLDRFGLFVGYFKIDATTVGFNASFVKTFVQNEQHGDYDAADASCGDSLEETKRRICVLGHV